VASRETEEVQKVHVSRAILFSSEPGEFIELDAHVTDDLKQEASPDVLTPVDGDDRCPTVIAAKMHGSPSVGLTEILGGKGWPATRGRRWAEGGSCGDVELLDADQV
jgi:hypothetical protein